MHTCMYIRTFGVHDVVIDCCSLSTSFHPYTRMFRHRRKQETTCPQNPTAVTHAERENGRYIVLGVMKEDMLSQMNSTRCPSIVCTCVSAVISWMEQNRTTTFSSCDGCLKSRTHAFLHARVIHSSYDHELWAYISAWS